MPSPGGWSLPVKSCEEGVSLLCIAKSDSIGLAQRGDCRCRLLCCRYFCVGRVMLLLLVLLLQTLIFLGKSHRHLKDSCRIPTSGTQQCRVS